MKLKTINESEIEVDAPIDRNIIINTALFIYLKNCRSALSVVTKLVLAHFFSIGLIEVGKQGQNLQ